MKDPLPLSKNWKLYSIYQFLNMNTSKCNVAEIKNEFSNMFENIQFRFENSFLNDRSCYKLHHWFALKNCPMSATLLNETVDLNTKMVSKVRIIKKRLSAKVYFRLNINTISSGALETLNLIARGTCPSKTVTPIQLTNSREASFSIYAPVKKWRGKNPTVSSLGEIRTLAYIRTGTSWVDGQMCLKLRFHSFLLGSFFFLLLQSAI